MSSFSTGCAEVGTLSQAIAERESVKKPKNKNKKKLFAIIGGSVLVVDFTRKAVYNRDSITNKEYSFTRKWEQTPFRVIFYIQYGKIKPPK